MGKQWSGRSGKKGGGTGDVNGEQIKGFAGTKRRSKVGKRKKEKEWVIILGGFKSGSTVKSCHFSR